uniref:Uncharacterized protein n=1 Tax=Rhizophora mucronata TaxID=61149 RepID=A0A2P2NFT6_RHIMU
MQEFSFIFFPFTTISFWVNFGRIIICSAILNKAQLWVLMKFYFSSL